MRIAVRSLRRFVLFSLLAVGSLALAGSSLVDYTGPDRTVSVWQWERRVCEFQAEYDVPGPGGYYSCTLEWYETPDSACPSGGEVAGYFNPVGCPGWPGWLSCDDVDCDISLNGSAIDGCNEGQPGCRAVEHQTTYPEATVGGSIDCASPGSGGWCRGGGQLSLSGGEPVAGYSIIALEGTQNGVPFYCTGAACGLPLVEGGNDFSFWAISSWGDTSLMGSAGGSLDSGDPALSGSVSGTAGDNGWFVSSVTLTATASDDVSGLASLDVAVNGGGWTTYSGPVSLGDGVHNVQLRAADVAGNSSTDGFDVDVDTQAPLVDLDAPPSFCPGCGETLGIVVIVDDGGSGVVDWDLRADGVGVSGGSSAVNQTVVWDGDGLGSGLHTLTLEGRDEAGHTSSASFTVGIILPTPAPTRVPTGTPVPTATEEGSLLDLFDSPTATASAAGVLSSGTPATARAAQGTPTPSTFFFGGPPAAPGLDTGEGAADSSSPPQGGASPAGAAPAPGVFYGAAALALGAAATAYALEQRRRREAEEARRRAEMERANAAAAREEAQFQLMLGQILNQATSGRAPSPAWMERREAMLEPRIPPPLRQTNFTATEAQGQQRAFRTRDQEPISSPAHPAERAWWERALDWVDQHQGVVSVVVGAAAAAAVILTAGAATPLVVAGLAALAAGGSVALGTAGLNSYLGRAWNSNLLRNTVVGVVGAAAITGGWWLATGGLTTIALGVGNTVAGACAMFPTACARVDFVMTAWDQLEQLSLGAQLGLYTVRGEPVPPELGLEIQLEQMDGGVPGNTTLRQLGPVGEEALERIAHYGDEASAIASVVSRRSDEVIDVLDGGVIRVQPDSAQDFAEDLLSELRAPGAGDIRVYYSATSGAIYASAPTTEALEALDQLEAIVRLRRRSGDGIDRLVDIIAGESIRGSGGRLVLGVYGEGGLYIHDALDNAGQFYDTGGEVYTRLKLLGLDWDVNSAALRQQAEAGRAIEFSLRGMGPAQAGAEIRAIEAMIGGELDRVRDILDIAPNGPIPAHLREVQWMLEAGYVPGLDDIADGVIRWAK